ncbi:hypothetical protein R3P38DRAFT_2808371 [Favolaschia claudopus]|uniref:Uncharacterized protein n=1 Tax=Favolaschia claudopus TaxID=2862362 RepID=A0AAV9ZG98_9AGAR
MALNGNRRAKTETQIAQSIVHRLPWVSGVLATVMGNPSTDSVKEAPETGEFSPRSTPWEGIQPKILGPKACHTEYTRQPPSTDVKVCDNTTTQTLRKSRVTGMNRATYSSGQGNGQQHIKMYDSRQSTRSAYFDFYKTTPHQANLYRHNYIRLSSYKEHQGLIAGKGFGLQKAARNEAFEQHYKAICLAGKSEGIEALKQDTDLNTAFERKSVVRIGCIWVFSMPCTQSLALQGPCILARVRDIDFRLLESTGISKEASYGNGELRS